MIVVAIIGILAAIAIPQYGDYTSRTRAAGAMAELDSTKTAIAMCVQEIGILTGCSAGSNGVPSITAVTSNITALPTVKDGSISATTGATDATGKALTISLVPTVTSGTANIVWTNSGTTCNATRGFKGGQGGC